MRAILLPGLDGTAGLRDEFVAALAPEFAAEVLAFPPDAPIDLEELAEWVRRRLPADEPFLLIGESYASPLAIRIAADAPPGLAGLVLSAGFAHCPRPGLARLRGLARLLPLRWTATWPGMRLLMGRWSTPQWQARLRSSLEATGQRALRERLLATADVDVSGRVGDIACPILYLRAERDRLVPADAWATIRDRSRNAVCIGVEGPHMLLQARATECAAAVKR